MSERTCPIDRFLSDVAQHQLEILQDDGTRRHLKFRMSRGGLMYFDLITWPGHLCITGDCETYVFSRVEDMFEFFRSPKGDPRDINPGYWHEKLQTPRKMDLGKEFDQDAFKAAVIRDFRGWFEGRLGGDGEYSYFNRRECWEQIKDEVFGAMEDGEHAAHAAVYSFRFGRFHFQDFWEHNTQRYTYHFIWCLYAIVWGIARYDEAKAKAAAQAQGPTHALMGLQAKLVDSAAIASLPKWVRDLFTKAADALDGSTARA